MTESEHTRADVQHMFTLEGAPCVRDDRKPPFGGPRRDPFPSLSLMTRPITPAPPRLRFFPDANWGRGSWRCRVDAADIVRHRHITAAGLTSDHYRATGPEGWGNTKERAYNAWKSKWRECMEKT